MEVIEKDDFCSNNMGKSCGEHFFEIEYWTFEQPAIYLA